MEPREIRIGHSPDPDDAFMFYALTHGKLDTAGLTFTHVIKDIESLNHMAVEGQLEVTALSVHAYGYVMDKYALLRSGGSFGDKIGPIVVARTPMEVGEVADDRIAVPGTMTSAYLLLKLLLMNFKFEVVPFDKIMDAVKSGEVDAGLLIHEGQITYEQEGLHKIVDLGAWWHADTGLPVPLGVNGVRKDLGQTADAEDFGIAHGKYSLCVRSSQGSGSLCPGVWARHGQCYYGSVCGNVCKSAHVGHGTEGPGGHRAHAHPRLPCGAGAAAGEFGVRGIMVCGGKRRARGARRVWRVPYRWLALLPGVCYRPALVFRKVGISPMPGDPNRNWGATVTESVGYDDNFNATEKNQESGARISTDVKLRASIPFERLFVGMQYNYDVIYPQTPGGGHGSNSVGAAGINQTHNLNLSANYTVNPHD